MAKSVQIPETFLKDVYRLVLLLDGVELSLDTQNIVESLRTQIEAKIERIERHELYTQSKTGAADQREQARQKYLDKTGVHPDWRY